MWLIKLSLIYLPKGGRGTDFRGTYSIDSTCLFEEGTYSYYSKHSFKGGSTSRGHLIDV